jgi:hypothetical protein
MAKKVSPSDVVTGIKKMKVNFSMHERGVNIDPELVEGNYIIDMDGNILEKDGPAENIVVTVMGGINSYAHRKDKAERDNYYMNEYQGYALAQLGYSFGASNKFEGEIESGNDRVLYNDLYSAFQNGRG